jgi:enoyl-[acyl-carrier-protein] reductase (NADH)
MMENLKLPVALVAAMAVQLAAGVWWVSQQAATIASLEETVSQIGSRMAIEDNINLKRDVQDNAMEIEYAFDDLDEVWDELANLANSIGQVTALQQRVSLLENDFKYIGRDHDGLMNMKGGMK